MEKFPFSAISYPLFCREPKVFHLVKGETGRQRMISEGKTFKRNETWLKRMPNNNKKLPKWKSFSLAQAKPKLFSFGGKKCKSSSSFRFCWEKKTKRRKQQQKIFSKISLSMTLEKFSYPQRSTFSGLVFPNGVWGGKSFSTLFPFYIRLTSQQLST